MAIRYVRRGRFHAIARLYPVIALALLAALLIWPPGIVHGGSDNLPANGEAPRTVPRSQATPEAVLEAETRLLPEDQSGIYLNKFECQGSFGGELQSLLENCTVVTNVNFDVFGPNLQLMANGGISLERLPAGLYRIREYVPAGYGDPTAFCGVGPTNGPLPTFTGVVVYDGYYEFELGPSQSIYCNWFNIGAPDAATSATLYINKHFCRPASAFDAYAASVYELAPNCQEPAMPIPFEVTKNGVRIGSGTANGAPDALVLTGLPAGPITIIEQVPDGFGDPRVFCTVKDELGGARAPLAEAQTDNDRAFWQLNVGDVVFCDWFNIPAPLGTSISVTKYICPPATGLPSYDDYAATCTETRADVSFKLDGARTGNPGEQLTDANGQITWAEMEADLYYLTEEVPAGFGTPVVYCSLYNPAALMPRVYEAYPVSSENRIEFEMTDGQFIGCAWFNLTGTAGAASPAASPSQSEPTDDPAASPDAASASAPEPSDPAAAAGTPASTTAAAGAPDPGAAPAALTIQTYLCQPGYDYLAADAEPAVDCEEQLDGPTFELSPFAGPSNQDRRRPDLGGTGSTFSGVSPGEYRLTAVNAPAGDTAFIETCQSNQRDFGAFLFSPFAIVTGDGSVRLSLIAGETLTCDWYDVPGEPDGQD